ncbi:MAG TPA: cell division protein FtsQ/DivIB [Patescibacteria group bacterium]|nr:cell division protein FtsQ/DivIB [Patescibacteria group bacterium]
MTERVQPHVWKRNVRIFGGVTVLVGMTILVSVGIIRVFTIRQVIVDAPGMTVTLEKTKFGNNLLFVSTNELRGELLATYPLLADVRFEKKIPSTLIVHLVRRQTFALLSTSGNTYAVDAYGFVLDAAENSVGYPVLRFDTGILSVGTRMTDRRVMSALSFLRALDNREEIRSIQERDGASLQAVMGNTNIFLPQSEELSAKAATLQTIIDGFRIKGTLPTVIDLRHEKPIITN